MINKRAVISLSVSAFISSAVIGVLTLLLVVIDGPFNIVQNVITGMRVGAAAVTLQALCSTLLALRHELSERYPFEKERVSSLLLNILKSCVVLFVATLIFHGIAVCFGAPFFESSELTYNFAILMAVLVYLPYCLLIGPSLDSILGIFSIPSELSQKSVVHFTSSCSVLGAWLGAVPIPLDWDRPWQEWPRSCAIGALAGYSFGLFLSAVYLPRRYRTVCKAKFT